MQRYWLWQSMEKRTQGLKVYSLRHGFAYRCHVEIENPISATEVAGLMGHDVNTHLKYYGRWVDEEALERAVKRLEGTKAEVTA